MLASAMRGRSIDRFLENVWVWVALLVAIAAIGAAVGTRLSALVFLVVPVVAAAWFCGNRAGIALAVAAALLSLGSTWLANGISDPVAEGWDTASRLAAYLIVAVLVARQRSLLLEQRRLATIDGLTGALNRAAFLERVDQELAVARRRSRPVSLVYLDVDDLKIINDSEGHAAGDEHLVDLAITTRRTLRRSDVFGRLGGDEFALLLPETNDREARRIASRLRQALVDAPSPHPIYASMGLVSYDEPPADADALLRRADSLMYLAKRGGEGLAVECHTADR
jgi:diguanylate cyclase (GGDEF)-like protein